MNITKIYNSFISFVNKTDEKLEKKGFQKLIFFLVLIGSFLLIYVLNILQPLFGDDWGYAMTHNYTRHLSNFSDIIHDQYEHYFAWGGRTIVHIIAQSLLLIGIPLGDLLNSIAYSALTIVIYLLANGKWEIKPSLLIVINLLIWFYQPALGSTLLWITGSANYLWGTLIILLFLLPYIKQIYKPQLKKNNVSQSLIFFMLGIIAGWTNENMVIALIFMLVIFLLYFKYEEKHIPKWAIFGFLGVLIGSTIMLSAPGNFVRYQKEIGQSHEYTLSLFTDRFKSCLSIYYYYSLALTFILLINYIIYSKYAKYKKKETIFISIIFFIGALIANLAMVASPIFPIRATFGIHVFLIVSACTLFASLDFDNQFVKKLSRTTIAFALLLFISDYLMGYKELRRAQTILDARIETIEKGKKQGIYDYVFDDAHIEVKTRFLHYWELPPDTNNWHNKMFSKYHEIKSISVKKDSE